MDKEMAVKETTVRLLQPTVKRVGRGGLDAIQYRSWMRMNEETFNDLLGRIQHKIQRQDNGAVFWQDRVALSLD